MLKYAKEEFYEDISLPGEVRALCPDVEKYENFLSGFLNARRAKRACWELFGAVGGDPGGFVMLVAQPEVAKACSDLYDDAGIPRYVYESAMRSFSGFLEEVKKRRGVYVFDRGRGTYRQTGMTIFRIGEPSMSFREETKAPPR